MLSEVPRGHKTLAVGNVNLFWKVGGWIGWGLGGGSGVWFRLNGCDDLSKALGISGRLGVGGWQDGCGWWLVGWWGVRVDLLRLGVSVAAHRSTWGEQHIRLQFRTGLKSVRTRSKPPQQQ